MTNQVEQQQDSLQTVELRNELQEKTGRIASLLERNNLSALLLSRHENIAWATAGQVEARVASGSETAVASLLITGDGRRYYVAPNNEGPRLAAEEFSGLGYEAVLYPWYQGAATVIQELTSGKAVG